MCDFWNSYVDVQYMQFMCLYTHTELVCLHAGKYILTDRMRQYSCSYPEWMGLDTVLWLWSMVSGVQL